ncbi:MAG: hypothetical protein DRR08_22815 [Candidatus Parabeggiatoa sp. nov. 2]|nr:MAG: hypothetical protein B6247_08750 [Beggiatoa sp. 4572_84]RKZ55981.1 MAG: hypothetical protein DRR08_22815 [Gammaproteobacteria bacterium]
MNIKAWAKKELISTVPSDIPLWHWSHAKSIINIMQIIQTQDNFRHFRQRAVGSGLYASTSAVDLMEYGPSVIHFKVKQGTEALMIHPVVFSVGVPEIFDMALEHSGWTDFHPSVSTATVCDVEQPADVIDELLDELELPCCFYTFGLYLACMVRDSRCIDFDPQINSNETVLAYHKANPEEVPMMAPHLLPAWLAKFGTG